MISVLKFRGITI